MIGLYTNTMHKVAFEIERQCSIPFLHIADPTIAVIQAQGLIKIGLLGTQFTMEQDFYISKFTVKILRLLFQMQLKEYGASDHF